MPAESSTARLTFRTLQWKVINDTGMLLLDQPPANAMTSVFFDELYHLTEDHIPKLKIKAIIIMGSGRHFSSGADLAELRASIRSESVLNASGNRVRYPESMIHNLKSFRFFDRLRIPVIAAIRGVCLGSGLELALHCHFRLASTNSVLALPEASYNLIPGLGGIQHILVRVPRITAIEMIFKGNSIDSDAALKAGLIDRIVPRNSLLEAAMILGEIAGENYRRYLKPEYLRRFHEKLKVI
jgi:enoyl-CoA hydratase